MISYKPFWKYCKENKISQYRLNNEYGITNYQLDMLRNNKPISLKTLEKICKAMNLKVEEVVEIK